MNPTCCQVARRGGEVAGWVLPSAALAFVPKCPACVAGYVALATGLGISLPVAAYVRASLVAVCLALLVYLAARRLLRTRAWLAGRRAARMEIQR